MAADQTATPSESAFASPPDAARPWVWGHWLYGNVDKSSITRQLEAIKRVGLGGVTMFDVAQPGIPAGPNAYFDDHWRGLFAWQIGEAQRLGLEVMSHNGPGYSGNGGPWITPELASQKIVHSATSIKGGQAFNGKLPQPEANGGFYRDVAVLAVRETAARRELRIADFDMKRLVWLNYIRWKGVVSAPPGTSVPKSACIPSADVVDLSAASKPDGSIRWEAPPGDWTLFRFGHTWTGQKTLPAPPEAEGPECDKLDPRGIRHHFNHVMGPMIALGGERAGKTFHSFFLDSWEAGGQNWTARMPEEFKRRRGYEIIPFLPVLAGRVIDDLETTERFLFDLRRTASELMVENFWRELRRLCHEKGMRLAAQTYITTGNDFDAANHIDEPMGEFWSHPFQPNDYRATVKLASSAANLNGRLIVGAEAFTADERERWLAHPATLKALGDQAFCLGANRFQFHRFAMQRFPQAAPGMTMGKWGQHYDSTQTWWEWSRPWHDYLARCQYLLRLGPVVTDVLAVTPEEPLWRFEHDVIPGHDSDACGPDSFARVTMVDGRPGIPGGPVYQLITVKHTGTMTVPRLKKLRDLVNAGAALLAEPPVSTPGLSPADGTDAELRALASELWGNRDESDRRFGKGRVFRSLKADEALRRLGVSPDFSSADPLSWIHRRAGETNIYFVANPSDHAVVSRCSFRVVGKRAERWDPETGTVTPLSTRQDGSDRSSLLLPLTAHGSAFVVFRPAESIQPAGVTGVLLDNKPLKPVTLNAGATAIPFEINESAQGTLSARFHSSGVYQIQLSDGTSYEAAITLAPEQPVNSPWTLVFPPSSGVKKPVQLESLAAWNEHPDSQIRHFSGTASYSNRFQLPETPPEQILIDLGRVEVMARVSLNGSDLGILWRPPFVIDASAAAKPGTNELKVDVVNLWPNRLIGDQFLPEDADRDAKGILTRWPDWLLEGRGSPTGRRSFVTFPLWSRKDKPVPSGLIGPVSLRFPQTRPLSPRNQS